jgi:Protein of unknown function (DUF3102)
MDDHFASRQQPTERAADISFNYASLSAPDAETLRDAARNIRKIHHAALAYVGRFLIEARKLLEHGEFQQWVEAELGMKIRKAQRCMLAAQFLDGKSVSLTLLPREMIYRLSAPSAPAAAVQAVVEAAEAGTPMPVQEINDLLDRARDEEKEIQREINEAKIKEKLLLTRTEAKGRAAQRKSDRLAAEEKRRATAEKERRLVEASERKRADRIGRINPVLQHIATTLTDENLVDLLEMLKDPYRFGRSLTPILQTEQRSRIAPVDEPTVPTEADQTEIDISELRA